MSSFRKKPSGIDQRDAPVASTPQAAAAELPPKTAEAEPPEIETKSPVEEAAQKSLRARLAEAERAEALAREAITQQHEARQQVQADPVEAFLATVPEDARDWLRAHPEYMLDQEKAAAAQHFHWAAHRETGETFTPKYFERLEHHLGIRPSGNGHAPAEIERPSPAPIPTPPRPAAPVRQQQRHSGPPVSAPPTRAAPSMTTGRPSNVRTPLTPQQREAARFSGISDEEYARQLEKMNQLKAAGVIQDGQ